MRGQSSTRSGGRRETHHSEGGVELVSESAVVLARSDGGLCSNAEIVRSDGGSASVDESVADELRENVSSPRQNESERAAYLGDDLDTLCRAVRVRSPVDGLKRKLLATVESASPKSISSRSSSFAGKEKRTREPP